MQDSTQANFLKKAKTQKQLVISKGIDDEILREVKENFEDPLKYLELSKKIIVGLIPFQKKKKTSALNRENSISISPKKNAEKKRDITSACSAREQKNDKILSLIHYDIVNEEKLSLMYSQSKERIAKSQDKSTQILSPEEEKKINPDVQHQFASQENILSKNDRSKLRSAQLSKYISRQTKKEEDDLLMNRIDEYRMQRQLKDIIENKMPLCEKYGNNYWLLTLRRPKNLTTLRTSYVNIGSNDNPIWKPYIECPKRPLELVQRPRTGAVKAVSSMMNKDYFKHATTRLKCKFPNVNEFNDLEVVGKNLLEAEFKILKKLQEKPQSAKENTRIFVYKDPFENKKEFVQNQVFGRHYEETQNVKKKTN